MKTTDCVKMWVDSVLSEKANNKSIKANSCMGVGKFFVSYNTPIAKFCVDHFEIATKKYSVTTSKQQTYLRYYIPSDMIKEVEEIDDEGCFPFRR